MSRSCANVSAYSSLARFRSRTRARNAFSFQPRRNLKAEHRFAALVEERDDAVRTLCTVLFASRHNSIRIGSGVVDSGRRASLRISLGLRPTETAHEARTRACRLHQEREIGSREHEAHTHADVALE